MKNVVVADKPKKKVGQTVSEREAFERLWELWAVDVNAFVQDVMPHHLTSPTPDFHLRIYDALFSQLRALIIAPRGHSKSTLCSVFYPLHQALFGFRKNIHIISASETVAIEFLRKIKDEFDSNQLINEKFGKQKTTKWSETHIILRNGANIVAKGAEAQSRGPRPDLIILDDIESEESVDSKERTEKLRTWLFKACINSLTPNGQAIWIGTVINHACLLYEMYSSRNVWYKLKFQAYIDGIEDEEHTLWSKLWSHEKLQMKKAEIGSTFFAAEYQNDPVDNDALPIKRDMIQTWEKLPESYNLYMAVDPAYSEDAKADFKTCVLVAVDTRGNRYLVNYVHTHDMQSEFNNAIINMYLQNKRRLVYIGIPNSGTEKSFFKQFLDECMRRGLNPPVKELKNVVIDAGGRIRKKKSARITAALQHLFEQGRYFVHSSQSEALSELLNIGISKHDDIVDAITYCEQIIDQYMPSMPDDGEERDLYDLQYSFTGLTSVGYGI